MGAVEGAAEWKAATENGEDSNRNGDINGRKSGAASPHPPALPPPPAQQLLPPFLSKCYDMVDDPSTDPTVSWNAAGNSFVVWDPHVFSQDLLPKYYKHKNLSSFVRQLNTYGFRKVDPDRWEFANEGFLRGQKQLLKTIVRRKPTQNPVQSKPPQGKNNSSVKACVEVGKFGFEEEIERLKRDKSVLMQELVKLRQHQQNTDNELRRVKERIQVMEQHQQQMMSFLAMAMQSPGFLAQLVQQNGNNRWRTDSNKKRRLPALEQGPNGVEDCSEGQIVKYQPLVTENSKPLLTSVPNNEVTPELAMLLGGINDLCMDDMSYEMDPSLSTEDEFFTDMPDDYLDWERLLASPVSENNREVEPHTLEISAVGMDFGLPVHENQVQTSQNLVPPNEQMAVEHLLFDTDNKY